MSLLKNAIDSIKIGVEDYQEGSHPRLLSSVRNMHAGILLLFKEALRRHSPPDSDEVLIKREIVSERRGDGTVIFKGTGRNTVNTREIKDRFSGLGIQTDWRRLKKLTTLRNEVEHYYSNATQDSMRGMIADSFIVIRNFLDQELEEDPLEVLGQDAWQTMLEISDLYEEERKGCLAALSKVSWHSPALHAALQDLTCEDCGSSLFVPKTEETDYTNTVLSCRSCGREEEPEQYIPRAISDSLGIDEYLSVKGGGESVYVNCPECLADTYIVEEERCAACGAELEHVCRGCEIPIPACELSGSPYCGWCLHMSQKR